MAAPGTVPARTSAPSERALDMACPACAHELSVGASALFEGHALHCSHCGGEPVVTRSVDGRWILVNPGDYDDDERP